MEGHSEKEMELEDTRGKVIYISRTIPHYRQRILSALEKDFDFEVLSGGLELGLGREADVANQHVVRLTTMRSPFGRGRVYWQSVRGFIKDRRPKVVISEFGLSLVHLQWLLFARKSLGFKLAFWTHGMGVHFKGPPRSIADHLRIHMLRRADGLFYYTGGCRDALQGEIGGRVPSWVVWNTLDAEAIDAQWTALDHGESPSPDPYVVYLGRLIPSKRVEELPRLAAGLREKAPGVRWKIIGNGPGMDDLKRVSESENLPMDFLGPITDEATKGRWMKHALAMVCPGMLGLNVVDALGYGCPILSYRRQPRFCEHSPEVEYLKEGDEGNGWLVETEDELVGQIVRLLSDPELLDRKRKAARKTFEEECRTERQLDGFREGLRYLLGENG